MALVTSGTQQNSYVTWEESEAYFATRIGNDAFTNSTDPNRLEQALITAFRALERITAWRGYPSQPYQAAKWPRAGVLRDSYETGLYSDEVNWPTQTVPNDVKYAQCEEALALLEDYGDSAYRKRRVRQRQGVTSLQLSDMEEVWEEAPRYAQGNLHSAEAYAYIRQYIAVGGTIRCERDMRGRW